MREIFTYIKADKFFPAYAPNVVNYKRKISGKNGRGNHLEFSEDDKKAIMDGLKKLFSNITK